VSAQLTWEIAASLVQLVWILLAGPLILGVMRKVRSVLEGRNGASILQPFYDLRKLAARERTRPEDATWIFSASPVVLVSSALVLGAFTPLASLHVLLSSRVDFVVVLFLLLLGSVALLLSALDTGTAFAGMGSSRAAMIGAMSEPALLVAILAMSLGAGTSNLARLVNAGVATSTIAGPARILALVSFFIAILAETGRLPVDNPATHLELTMIHEAMVLEYAGPDLALITLGESMRLVLLVGLFANLALPWGVATHANALGLAIGVVAVSFKVALVAVAVSIFEVSTAKLRLFRVPELLAGAFLLGVLSVISAVALR
jgi:formate hydrogenlyase subunit 4